MATIDFCDDYMFVNAQEATFLDLLHLLWSSKWEERNFIKSRIEKSTHKLWGFRYRWLIFVSVVVQKLFILLKKPMAVLCYVLELWLNLVSANGGVFMLLLHLIQGKTIWVDKSSTKFISASGHLDDRFELDKTVIRDDENRYYSSLSIMASKLSYEYQPFIESVVNQQWMMKFSGFYDCWNEYQELASTQALIVEDRSADSSLIVVAFRGTDPFDADDYRTNFDLSWYELPNVGKVHGGFIKALGLQKTGGWPKEIEQINDKPQCAYYAIKQTIRDIMQKNKTAKFILTGHSLGGALAILFAAVLILHEEEHLLSRLEGVYTYGQPRVGDEKFGEFMVKGLKKFNVNYFRYVYCNDMVPRLPYDDKTLLFKHFGSCLYYDSLYRGKVEEEEPNRNYFNLLLVVPKYSNAVWELLRGFKYRESWFMIAFRLVGLVVPGLPAHFPPNYVNVIRLGSVISPLGRQSRRLHDE